MEAKLSDFKFDHQKDDHYIVTYTNPATQKSYARPIGNMPAPKSCDLNMLKRICESGI